MSNDEVKVGDSVVLTLNHWDKDRPMLVQDKLLSEVDGTEYLSCHWEDDGGKEHRTQWPTKICAKSSPLAHDVGLIMKGIPHSAKLASSAKERQSED